MSLLNFARTYRNILRTKQIIKILTKHGFGHIIGRLHLKNYIPHFSHLRRISTKEQDISEESIPVRIRLAFEELGPTFIKLGQILSGRPDMLPPAYINEFKELQDNVPPFSSQKAKEIIEHELNGPTCKYFKYFKEEALASGSIGQAHEASLSDGDDVIIKVKRPGIEQLINTDISILHFLAELAERYIEEIRFIRPVLIIDEFSRSVHKELDFIIEASYTTKFHEILKDTPNISSPKVFWDYTSSSILTVEKLQGFNIGQTGELDKKGIDRRILAGALASVFMKQYFVTGLFHADPHPGNILVSDNGVLGLIDFGMVGHLSSELKSQLATLILALVKCDIEMIVEIFSDIGVFPSDANLRELRSDILELLDKYFGTPLQHIDMANVFQDTVYLARIHNILLPRDFVLLGKSLVTITSLIRELDPNFNLAEAISPHVITLLKEKFSPERITQIASLQTWNLLSLLQRLPSAGKEILRKLRSGNFQITLRHESFPDFIREIKRSSIRLSYSLIFASVFIGTSILVSTQIGSRFHGLPVVAIVGYGISLVLAIKIILSGSR